MGGWQLAQHRITLGSFVMFNTYMGMLVWPMIAMGWVANLMQRGRASLTRIQEWIDERPKIAAPADARALPESVRGEIELRDVTVRYGDRAALEDVNLHIAAGETVAIVGHTGSGKSTLAHLIPRLIDPSSGMVRLDGVRPARILAGGCPARHRLCSAGDFFVQRDARRKYRVRREGGERSRVAPRGRDRGAGARYRRVSGGSRDHRRRARDHAFRRAEAAHRDRAGDFAQSADPDSGRRAGERRHGRPKSGS